MSSAQIPTRMAWPRARCHLYVRLPVEDTGTGIAPEQLDRIFDLYFPTEDDETIHAIPGGMLGDFGFITAIHAQDGSDAIEICTQKLENRGEKCRMLG